MVLSELAKPGVWKDKLLIASEKLYDDDYKYIYLKAVVEVLSELDEEWGRYAREMCIRDRSEVEITLDMLQRGLDGWYTEAKRLLECEFTMAFSEKYFTQEFMQDLFDEEFPHADSDGTVASLIARREEYYLGQ